VETPDWSTRAVWQSYQQSSCSKVRETVKGNDEFCLAKYVFHISMSFLTCRKISGDGSDALTSPRKKVVLRILSPLKIIAFSWV
jgi:hypothetical protein